MIRYLFLAFGLSLFTVTIRADEPNRPPSPSPLFVLVHNVQKDSATLVISTDYVRAQKEVARTVNEGGKITHRKEIVNEYVPVEIRVKKSLKDAKVYDGTGKQIETAEVLKLLKPGMAILMTLGNEKVNPAFLALLKKETLILVLPANTDVPIPVPEPKRQ